MSRTDYEEDAAAPSMVLERVRRNRTAVNYAEKVGDARSRPAEHISAVLAEANEQGTDLASMAKALHKRMESSEETPVPYGAVRQVLIGMLRSGRARRRVRAPPAVLPGDSESALRCLVLNTMQIDPDRAAPWSLEARPRPMRAPLAPRITRAPATPSISCRARTSPQADVHAPLPQRTARPPYHPPRAHPRSHHVAVTTPSLRCFGMVTSLSLTHRSLAVARRLGGQHRPEDARVEGRHPTCGSLAT